MFRSSYLKRCRIFSMFLSLIFILGLVANSPAMYAAGYTATKSVEIQSPDYNEGVPGSWQVDKSGEWVGKGKAKVTFDVDTSIPQGEDEEKRHKDVLLALDVSASMAWDKLSSLQQQASQLIDDLLTDPENRIAIICFNGGGQTIQDCSAILTDGFINDSNTLQSAISNLTVGGEGTDYHAAFVRMIECLEGYTQREKTDLNILFLTDGKPNQHCYLQVGDFKELKEKYPYALVHGIQYELGGRIYHDVKVVSDVAWFSDKTNLYDILNVAAYSSMLYSVFCEKFEIVDYVNNDLFRVNSVDDIKVDYGSVELKEENGQQKIIWILNNFYSYTRPKMEINLTLKEGKEGGYDGFFPTNTKEDITYKFPEQTENKVTSEKTPVLQNYTVHYNANRPSEKANNYDDAHTYGEENHQAFETVEKGWPNGESCDGYLFKGWKYADPTPDETRSYWGINFIMPSADVYLNGTWGKFSVKKSMRGDIATSTPTAMFNTGANVSSTMKQLSTNVQKFAYAQIDGLTGGFEDESNIKTARNLDDTTEIKVVSVEECDGQSFEGKVYMWYESADPNNSESKNTIYWTSDVEEVMFNPDCRNFFSGFAELQTIDDFDKLNANKVTNVSYMFSSSPKLTFVDLSHFETGKLTTMGAMHMFNGCQAITSIDLSKLDASEVEYISDMFKGCKSLTTLVLGDKFAPTDAKYSVETFYGCENLETIDLSNIKGNLSYTSYMFQNCTKLKTIIVNDDLTCSDAVQSLRMFLGCTSLVGGEGTAYDGSITDKTYARIDDPTNGNPGYFTAKS